MKNLSPLTDHGTTVDMDTAMTPMIDVVFLLLVFFVWTASFTAVEQILPSELSSQIGSQPSDVMTPPPEQDFDRVIVRIRQDAQDQPRWSINDQPFPTLAAVEPQLQTLASVASATPVILHPDETVSLGNVIETYDVTKRCGFKQVSFAVGAAAVGN